MNNKKILLWVVVVIALVAGIFWLKPYFAQAPERATVQTNKQIQDQPIIFSDYVRYPGESGKNAYELLLLQKKDGETIKVESKQYDFGVFVQSINGLKPDDKHFWKLYINGQESQVGADKLQTHKGDIIEWKLEVIK